MTLEFGYTYSVQLSPEEKTYNDQQVGENRRTLYQCSKNNAFSFGKGLAFGLAVAPSLVNAKEEVARGAKKKIQVEAAEATRRATNAIACGAVMSVCKVKAAEKAAELGPGLVAANSGAPVAAFLCGACLAWCAKYVIFDK